MSTLLESVQKGFERVREHLTRIPHGLIALLARFSMAAVFWKSGQTKVTGFAIDPIDGVFQLGWPHLNPSAVFLFRDEYRLPVLPPELAAMMAATAEHVFPVLLLLGLGTRFAALGMLGMTAVIEIFVYPDAYPVHATWSTVLLYLMANGAGAFSLDQWVWKRARLQPWSSEASSASVRRT